MAIMKRTKKSFAMLIYFEPLRKRNIQGHAIIKNKHENKLGGKLIT